ncbi:uncharacterized protein EKO05_0000649 [Ascochyta rabiei]|uniref:Uncharacterized protein n=1 Tax=Didymella rabiei TaxID=5454 RepID=A0A163HRI4_DIDRA|nr:uncharacterized protein EKO05_0000649 [Ascochyta rabiei]KZM25429.1 hypothetical protein ST47_g3571 [Ascochyta rabiei]UPX09973.1 hypothetical protein EKO05_0000649 [Ascochyta rabiei]
MAEYFKNPPPGLDLTESRTATGNIVGIVLFISAFVFVSLRLFTRLRLKREPLGLDDYLMFVGLALNGANLAFVVAGGRYGLGKHIWSLQPFHMRKISIITFIYVFIYTWSVCIIKFSILALYRRIFGLSWLGYCCFGLTLLYLIVNHVVLPLYTRPLSYYWEQWYGAQGVLLVNEAKFYLGMGIVNLFGDICMLAVPISSVLKLQMERTQKVAICCMFLLGSFVCFASLYRIITILRLVSSRDISWAKSDVFLWSSVEPSIGIISGCLPVLRPLMTYILESWFRFVPEVRTNSSKKSKSSRNFTLNPLETISKKRTRKIKKHDLESTNMTNFTQIDEELEVDAHGAVTYVGKEDKKIKVSVRKGRDETGTWRPDDDEMCLTKTTAHRSLSGAGMEDRSKEILDRDGIRMTTKFEWDEASRHRH